MATLRPVERRPSPEETRPGLAWFDHAWRYVACAVVAGVLWLPVAGTEWREHQPLFWVEVLAGAAAFVLVGFRRRAPLQVALVVALLSAVSGIAAGPATLAAVSLATLRQPLPIVAVGVTNFVCANVWTQVAPFGTGLTPLTIVITLVVNAGMMGWGMYLGSRRELVWTLRHRAERAEEERDARVRQARVTERSRIAREMHDVLAHRITQVSMHAGALAFRDDLDAAHLRSGLGEIQGQANAALHELRGVLGVLREDGSGEPEAAPQPTYDDIARLVAEAQRSGMNVQLTDSLDHGGEVPDAVARTAYRIIQEGLTNARKHAPGALVTVRLSGDRERGVDVLVRNPLGFATATPGAGLGLVGLRERAELAGGHLDHWRDSSAFVLHGWIPWPA